MQAEPESAELAENRLLAERLDEVAQLLEAQQANPFRVRAYRQAAERLRGLEQPVRELFEQRGLEGLEELPAVGHSLARSIRELLRSGRLGLLERLRGETDPEEVLRSVPGLGPELAARIHHELGIETLEELEAAAHDGRLERLPGLGPRRIKAIRESLAGRLMRRPPPRTRGAEPSEQPPVGELLDVDREYRDKAERGRLPRIAPRRFNPTGAAWLPVLHTQRGERHYTVLYSNTARAHQLGTLKDWVVIYRDDHDGRGQWTVITAQFGALRGRRVVRGREAECERESAQTAPSR